MDRSRKSPDFHWYRFAIPIRWFRSAANNFRTGVNSAIPVVGQANTGGRGAIIGQALESSNVDIANEFTKLIIYQRSYSANARVVTTTDEISQETINLKR